jgi:prefoldin subunit 5
MEANKMTLTEPTLVAIALTVLGAITALSARIINEHKKSTDEKIKDLSLKLDDMDKELQHTRENYVTKHDFGEAMSRLIKQLDRIESKMESKQSITACNANHNS